MRIEEENHFEKSSDPRSLSAFDASSGAFGGRKPWGLDARGADVDSIEWSFDHGIRRSPAEKLILKGFSTPNREPKFTADEESCYENYRYRLSGSGTVRLVAYAGCASHVEVPAVIEGVSVTSLATNLFRDHDELQSVSLPDSVEYVGNHVFDGCVNLRNVRLSASLTQVGPTLFLGCCALVEVTISNSAVHLESNSFSDAPVACVHFGPQVRSFEAHPRCLPYVRRVSVDEENERFATDGKALFSKDRKHFYRLVVPCKTYEVPEPCADIDERAFDSLSNLGEVFLPSTLQRIGRLAFAKTSLSWVNLPPSVESIGEKAFYHCAKLAGISLSQGLKHIDAEAFAFSSVQRFELPASIEHVGFRAFDHTPAQMRIGEGAVSIAAGNQHLELDGQGGLYHHDVFVELIGRVASYHVRSGTHAIGDEAFKRHGGVRAVKLPEGVFSVGREAFRGNRQLRRVDCPESLERIGDRAFLDTALDTLRLSRRVRVIGENALLVQGENQLMPKMPLRSLSLDARNPVFYSEGGLLCQREGDKAGGDSCLLYVGPDSVVRMPDAVTRIASLAFCGVGGVEELFLHDHLRSICVGAFSTARSIARVHVDFPRPIDGFSSGDFAVPELSARYRSPSYLFDAGSTGTIFDFEYYDSWVTHAAKIAEFAPAGLSRLMRPMGLTEQFRELYENIFLRKSRAVCRYFADKGDFEALFALYNRDLLGEGCIGAELEKSTHEGRTQATACLLELQHRCRPSAGVDFSL